MATAWARLAFNEEFTFAAADKNAASSPARREKGATASSPAAEDATSLLDDDKLIDCTLARITVNEELAPRQQMNTSIHQPPKAPCLIQQRMRLHHLRSRRLP